MSEFSGLPEFEDGEFPDFLSADLPPEQVGMIVELTSVALVSMAMPTCWKEMVANDERTDDIARECATISQELIGFLADKFHERHIATSLRWGTDRCQTREEDEDTPQQVIGW